jgi:hypothetical protein
VFLRRFAAWEGNQFKPKTFRPFPASLPPLSRQTGTSVQKTTLDESLPAA